MPWFHAAAPINPEFAFSSLGGRFVLLVFIGSSRIEKVKPFLDRMIAETFPFQDDHILAFAVSKEIADHTDPYVERAFPRNRVFHDPKFAIAKEFGLINNRENGDIDFLPAWYIIDPTLRVYAAGKLTEADRLFDTLRHLPKADEHIMPNIEPWAPVLAVPRVLPLELCTKLIELYKDGAPKPSGFMWEKDGKTIGVQDSKFKRRTDLTIEDLDIRKQINAAIHNRLKPEILKAFQFNTTRIERYIVACYTAAEAGFFRPHRDNTTSGTAHRRFAVTINLNEEEFEGGELRFPEYGDRTYRAPTGGAIVFSCSLLHEALPVTKGVRYATLPFLFDEDAAKIQETNRDKLDDKILVIS